MSLALGEPFFGHKVVQAGGTLILAGEASGTIEARIDAAKIGRSSLFYREAHGGPARDVPDRLPIAWANVGGLSDPKMVDQLLKHIAQIASDMQERFGIPLALIVVDTLAASFGFNDENDAAEATAAMKSLERISQATDTLMLGVAHYGKVAETGVRGSSAFTASSDVILAAIADKDQITGAVGSRRLALIKSRTGATGWGCPFELRQVSLGTDEDGDAITSCVVMANLDATGTAESSPSAPAGPRLSPAAKLLFECVVGIIIDKGAKIRPFGFEGPEVTAAQLPDVECEFFARYATPSGTEEQRRDAKRKAYKRALDRLVELRRIVTREDERGIFVWLASQPSSKAA
ncbi:MAG: AAA family ATPase [Labrys sp. (in: a-proteobacteria)]